MTVTVSVSRSSRQATRIGRRLAASCLAVSVAVVVPAGPASVTVAHRLAAIQEDSRAVVWSPDLNLEYNLNIAGGGKNNGAHVILWHEPNKQQSNERFFYPQESNTEIQVLNSKKCLGVYESGGLNYVVQWSCNGNSDQKWNIRKTDSSGRHNILQNVKYDKCMNVAGGDPVQGANIILWACNGDKGNNFTQYPVR